MHWNINPEPLRFECEDKEIGEWVYGYDPRVCFIEDRYYVTWCNGYHGPTIGVAYTFDFKTFHQLENAFLPFNRNGVLFPKKFNGNFAMEALMREKSSLVSRNETSFCSPFFIKMRS